MQKRKLEKFFFNTVILIGIVLIGVGVWTIVKKNIFKTYKNKKIGFSIKYPAAWELNDKVEGVVVMFLSPVEHELDFFRENVNIIVQDISKAPMSFEEYTETAINQLKVVFGENLHILESEPVFLDAYKAHKLVYLGKGPEAELKIMHIWTVRGFTAYQFTYTAISSQFDKYYGKIEKMLNSMTF